jgi:hypothetical protein
MTRSMLFATASVAAVLALGVASLSQVGAQTPPATGQPAAPGGQAVQQPGAAPPPGAAGYPAAGAPVPEGQPWPIIFVASVELLRSKDGRDIVLARGLVTSKGWSQPNLIPINHGAPIDGVLDLLFEAQSPASAAALGEFMEIDALLPLGHQHPYKAIRVRSGANALTLKTLPGYAEVKKLKNDCSGCLGKYFVAKGGTPPTGVAADNIVKEEDLLWEVRVIKPNQGIANYTVNPNRLTLVLTEDGRISDAAWD